MKKFYGTQEINAKPMNRLDLPSNENGADLGYLVEKKGDANTPEFDGYVQWLTKEQFEADYNKSGSMTFGEALVALKTGEKVSRSGWNGKDMWIVYMSGMSLPPFNTQDTNRKVNDRTAKLIGEDTPLETLPYLAMWTADQKWLPGWLASQSDMLASDWGIVG